MKVLVTWSSKTGNTKSVGEAIGRVCPPGTKICPIEEAPAEGGDFDFLAIGYWVDKGVPDKKCRDYLKSITGKKIAFFGTLGAYPDSDHAKECMRKAEDLALENEVCGHFICQGRVDPKLLEMMAKMPNNPHPMTEERKARIEEAKKHPNEEDFKNAQQCFQEIFSKIEQ
ncbi:MAG: flavodoxin [Deltaproteobacteria bacterium]|nr:MAG: flavodoxin [Deltaproteobacteria bacterium]PIE73107.1 MAG: flavodoxin [Deltaproteobacteria bacterium]